MTRFRARPLGTSHSDDLPVQCDGHLSVCLIGHPQTRDGHRHRRWDARTVPATRSASHLRLLRAAWNNKCSSGPTVHSRRCSVTVDGPQRTWSSWNTGSNYAPEPSEPWLKMPVGTRGGEPVGADHANWTVRWKHVITRSYHVGWSPAVMSKPTEWPTWAGTRPANTMIASRRQCGCSLIANNDWPCHAARCGLTGENTRSSMS
ncbi:hypothetical protein SAMN05661093_08948 [Kibdelosporangium aridum]|uniref:Uncharacterized protein n=1 Tax=Kibdelosporangium aridum TaxID=2030 RepID=A0A1Y5Y655_KIBAR|nr:hypothetical protein SAMN05661093_08948 [Kibdelosporangium aridum]